MIRRKGLAIVLALVVSGGLAGAPLDAGAAEEHQHELGIMESMSSPHAHHGHMDAHMHWTPLKPQTSEDQQRATEIVATLQRTLEKYRDYQVAIEDGYKPFLPHLPLPEYHFTNYWRGFKAAFRFDPAQPTSLLYKKTADGYKLMGAMYTASKRATAEDLDERVPLSVARWHTHVNICLPPTGHGQQADWTKFGPRGSITTKEECSRVGGRFHPQLFGWMVHVYPFEQTPAQVWSHGQHGK